MSKPGALHLTYKHLAPRSNHTKPPEQTRDGDTPNQYLGLLVEARDYRVAAKIIQLLGIRPARIITNNPDRIAQPGAACVPVVDRIPVVIPVGHLPQPDAPRGIAERLPQSVTVSASTPLVRCLSGCPWR
jgi:hypothetical protein